MRDGFNEWEALGVFDPDSRYEQPQEPAAAPIPKWYHVYLRGEDFGKVHEDILDQVKGIMASAGGFDFQPEKLTINSMHEPRHYSRMCREILQAIMEHDRTNRKADQA